MCAVIKQGILGAFSGRVGSVVGSSWKGIAVMKSLPPSVSNPKSTAQTTQRNAMKGSVSFAQAILADVIKPLNDRFVSRQSGYNSFISRNIANFENGVLTKPEDLVISPSLRKGQLVDAIAAEAKVTKARITWDSSVLTGGQKATDLAYAVGYAEDSKKIAKAGGVVLRSANQIDIEWLDGEITDGEVVHIWLAFLSADGTTVFSTEYKQGVLDDPA
jgi:hypothetical protein